MNGVSASHRGEAAEHQVAADLLEQGYTVSWPSSHAVYDLIVECPTTHQLYRVQVKRAYFGTHTFGRPDVWMVNVRHGDSTSYPADAFDVLAIVVGADNGPKALSHILYLLWEGQYRGQKIVDEDMLLEYGRFPCAN